MDVISLPLERLEDLKQISSLKPGTGLIFPPDSFVDVQGNELVSLAARYHLPAIYGVSGFASARGGLISYAPDFPSEYRQAASYVDRILRGTKIADLPVQNPRTYFLSINLKTAKTLGLTVPQSLLIQADEVTK
jgi:putative ABC transport system substrate-binding protein